MQIVWYFYNVFICCCVVFLCLCVFFFKQKTAYEMRISDWSSDVCSSDLFVLAVPADKKEAYRRHAAEAVPLFKEFGVTRQVEAWGDDVPDGKVTAFKGAVKAEPGEVVVFGWFEYPSRAARAAANGNIRSDPRMHALGAELTFPGRPIIPR